MSTSFKGKAKTSPKMDEIRLSEVEVTPVRAHRGLVAWASCVIDDRFYVGDIAVFTRLDGNYRLAYPVRTLRDGRKIPVFHPINHETATALEQAITSRVEALLERNDELPSTKEEMGHETVQGDF